MLKEFKEFAMRGNVLDMAVGIIIGAAFGKIITSFVSDILMPPLGLLLGKVDFSSLFLNISGEDFPSLAAAKEAGSRDHQLRRLPEHGARLPAGGLRGLPADKAGQPAEAGPRARRGGAGHKGLRLLPFGHSDQGGPLPPLHFATRVGARHARPLPHFEHVPP